MDYRIFTVRMCSVGLRIHKGTLVYGLVRRRFINVSFFSGRYNYSFMSQQINSGTGWLARAHTHSRPRLTHARTHAHTQHARAHAHTHCQNTVVSWVRMISRHRFSQTENATRTSRRMSVQLVNISGHYNRRLTQNVQW